MTQTVFFKKYTDRVGGVRVDLLMLQDNPPGLQMAVTPFLARLLANPMMTGGLV